MPPGGWPGEDLAGWVRGVLGEREVDPIRHGRVGIRLIGRLLPSGQVNMVRIIGNDDLWLPGAEIWRLDERFHREDGPAFICPSGYEAWYLHGRHHRKGGPAIIRSDGYREWYLHGRLHREDGPARTHPDGLEEWWEHGRRVG